MCPKLVGMINFAQEAVKILKLITDPENRRFPTRRDEGRYQAVTD